MRTRQHRAIAVASFVLALGGGCSCGGPTSKPPYPTPPAADMVANLMARNQAAQSFQTESVMDYWVGDERVRGTVLVMGKRGAFIRFNALSPAGDTVAADLACDGADFSYVDYNHDCQLAGACSKDAIAQLLRVSLEPDDFLLLTVGSCPIIEYDKSSTKWNSSSGQWQLTLVGADGTEVQEVLLDAKDKNWDVRTCELKVNDKTSWKVTNKDFHEVKDVNGAVVRVPQKTRFEQPLAKADLLVKWKVHQVNLPLGIEKFQFEVPDGLKQCGAK